MSVSTAGLHLAFHVEDDTWIRGRKRGTIEVVRRRVIAVIFKPRKGSPDRKSADEEHPA